MDPVSITCALVTIGGVGGTAARFTKSAYDIFNDAKMFGKVVEKLTANFDLFAIAVKAAASSIRRAFRKYPMLSMVRWIAAQGAMDMLERYAKCIQTEIRSIRDRMERIETASLLRRMIWIHMNESRIDRLHPQMACLELQLNLLQHSIMMDILMQDGDSPAIKEEIRELKGIMKHQGKILEKIVQQQLRHEQIPVMMSSDESPGPALSLRIMLVEASDMILKLEKTLRRSEEVPEVVPMPSHGTSRKPSRTNSRVPQPGTPLNRRTSPVPQPQLRRSRPTSSAMREEVQPRSNPRIVIPETALKRHEENERQATEQPRDSLVSEKTELTRRSSTSTTHTTPESPNTPTTPGPVEDDSHDNVRESPNHDSIVDLEGTAEEGYIAVRVLGNRQVRRSVTAKLFPTLSDNFICVRKAGDLGLDVNLLDSYKETRSLWYGRIGKDIVGARAVGSVSVNWWKSAEASNPNVYKGMHMWVMEGLPADLSIILGQPFVKRRHYFWDH